MKDSIRASCGNQRTLTVVKMLGNYRKQTVLKDYSYHKEKIMLCKQEEKGVPLSAEQSDWLHDTDEEPDEQELEAHYMYMAKIRGSHTCTQAQSAATTVAAACASMRQRLAATVVVAWWCRHSPDGAVVLDIP
ncbi:hypothetical protein Tco_0739927 [Tanacetum coccineum]